MCHGDGGSRVEDGQAIATAGPLRSGRALGWRLDAFEGGSLVAGMASRSDGATGPDAETFAALVE